ncbi:MAG: methyltransferase domain-containing protein [Phycisphaerales bacterium]
MTDRRTSDEPAVPSPPEWWRSFFDLTYASGDLIPSTDADRDRIAALAPHIAALLRVGPGSLVFDQCSGMGRMSHALGRLGVRTIGVELSPEYVAAATRTAADEGLPCRFMQGDAFEVVAPEPCDAGLNWFTSFGYTDDDRRNAQMLDRMRESLRPGARFLLEILSLPRLFATFRPCAFRRVSNPQARPPLPELVILDEPRPDFRRGMIESTWTYLWPDGRRDVRRVRTRMYMPHDLVRLCEGAGLRVVDLLGDPTGRPFDRESPRLLLLAERPATG